MHVFKRKIYDILLRWKREDDGKTAILIKGARRVGKSTIVEEFAKNEYDSHILIDFAKCSDEVRRLFDDISDLNFIFMRLQMIYRTALHERKSVIIFDEVQKKPQAREAIKYLVQDGRYDYIETGSLISIRKNTAGIVLPSEEEQVEMFPMDYEEFRWALGDTVSIPLLRERFDGRKPLGDVANRSLMRDFRLYMLIGGMPQAVATYLETNNMAKVDRTKRGIIRLYEDDFMKIDPSGHASMMFHAIPAELNRNASRYRTWSSTKGASVEDLQDSLSAMSESLVVNMAYHANMPSPGLALHQDLSRFKMFVGDTGLFVTLAFWDKRFTENVIYEKLLSDKLGADLGYVFENVVAQTLRAAGHRLYYHTFPTESGKHNYEIDFLIADGDKVSPIEVKSSGYKAHTSMDAFCDRHAAAIKHKYLVYTKDLRKDGDMLLVPAYMAMFL